MNPLTTKENQTKNDLNNQEILNTQDIETLKKSIQLMADEIGKLKDQLKFHNHNGIDGTKVLENSVNLKPTEIVQLGNLRIEEITDRPVRGYMSGYIVIGPDKDDEIASDNTQFVVEHRSNTNKTTNQSFIYADRYPLFTGNIANATSGTSIATLSDASFEIDELVGAQLIISLGDGSIMSKYIISNKKNTVTIQGTWPYNASSMGWTIAMPVYLGYTVIPWRMLYTGGDSVANNGNQRRAIRFGHGNTSECQAIYFGSGSPESVVTAVVGSLYLRSDGGSTTTLYVKTSGTSSTGWTAK